MAPSDDPPSTDAPPAAPDETLILSTRPSPWLIFRRSAIVILILAAATTLAVSLFRGRQAYDAARWAVWIGEALSILKLASEILLWLSTRYVLTSRRIMSARGVIRRIIIETPLEHIQHVVVIKGYFERATGLGTLMATTSGNDGIRIVWLYLADPAGAADRIRAASDTARHPRPPSTATTSTPARPPASTQSPPPAPQSRP